MYILRKNHRHVRAGLLISLLSFNIFSSCVHTGQILGLKVKYKRIESIESDASDASDNGEGPSVSIETRPQACDNYNYQLFQRTQERLKHPSLIERIIDKAFKWLCILFATCTMLLVLYNKGVLSFDTTPSNSNSSVLTSTPLGLSVLNGTTATNTQ